MNIGVRARSYVDGNDDYRTGFNVHCETMESNGDSVVPISSSESDKRVIQYVIGHLSAGLDGLSEDVLLRLKNARNAAVVRRHP